MKLYQCVPDCGGWTDDNQYLFCIEYNKECVQFIPKRPHVFIRDEETFSRWFYHGHLSRTVIK